jgi:DNA-binding beta-propeller fold protein YncE
LFGVAAAMICCAGPATAIATPARFGTEGTGAGQLSAEPQGIAVNQESGEVFVSDRENNRIDKFDAEGNFLLAFGWGVADGKSEELQTCTSVCFAGLEGSGTGEFGHLSAEGIAVDNDPLSLSHGDIYVLDSANLRVQKFTPAGAFLTMFGGEVNATTKLNICRASEAASCQAGVEGSGPGQFEGLAGRAIAVDSTGIVYVGDRNRVQRFSEEGVQESEVEIPGAGRIQNLVADSAKDIYLWGGLQEGVHKYDPTGTELGTPRDGVGVGEALAITIGPADELLVNDFKEAVHHIFGFNPEGEQLVSFDEGGLEQDGHRGIAYSEVTKALYILNKGTVRIVTPPPPGPFVLSESESASEIEPTSAKLEAAVNPEGGEETKCHFEYGTTTAYGQSTSEALLEGGAFEDQPVSAPVTGLAPRTIYHFRASCENAAKETSTGEDQAFTTLPPVSIDQTSASQVNATSARLEAELNPHGLASEYHFEYGTTTAYGASIPIPDGSVGSAKVDTTVENLIQELIPSTTYHYRVVAHDALGTVTGPDRSFTTQGPASILPDGRTWEMVSPANKHGSPLESITEAGGLIQSAAGGGAFAYIAMGPIDTDPKGTRSPSDVQLLATRGASGWSTQNITTPNEGVSIIHVGSPSEYKYFAEDLSSSLVEPDGATPLSPKTTERTPYRREANGEFVPLVTAENVAPGTKFGGAVEFRTATSDLSHLVLASNQILTPGFEPGFEPGEQSFYELTGGKLTLVSVLPSGQPTAEAGVTAVVGHNNKNMRGAISSDGNRVAFEVEANGHLYLRDVSLAQTLQVDEAQPKAAGGPGQAEFQAANSDASKIFFTDASRLTSDSTARANEPDLYMCEVEESEGELSCALSDLSIDPNPTEAANAQGEVSAIDATGAHVYFAANGVLTSTPNAQGEKAVPGLCNSEGESTCNLYEYNTATHQPSLVAVLSSHDDPDWAGTTSTHRLGNLTARSSPNGRYLTFMSRRSLTGYDNRDARSGQPDEEVFQLDSSNGKLSCVSCNPSGARPNGVFDKDAFPGLLVDHPSSWGGRWLAGSIPGWTLGPEFKVSLYQSRYLSNSGREFFNSSDQLVPQDTNNVNDVYEFEPPGVGDCSSSSKTYSSTSGGCVSLISSGGSQEESAFLDASETGDEVFFLTNSRLLKTDVDSAFDVYDAHVCSSSSPCPPPPAPPTPACEGDSCQNPSPAAGETTPSSLTYKGPENPLTHPPTPTAPAKGKAKAPTKAELLARALRACNRKPKRQRPACRRQAHRRYGAKKASKATHRSRGKGARHTQGRGGAR